MCFGYSGSYISITCRAALPDHLAQGGEGFAGRTGSHNPGLYVDLRRLSSRRFLYLTRLPVFESRGRTTCGVIRRTAQCLTLGTKSLHQQPPQPLLPAAQWKSFQPVQEDRLQCHAGIELYYDSVPGFRLSHRRVVSLAADMEMDYANGVTTRQRKPDTLAVGVFDFGGLHPGCR